jgi:chaperonin GroES
MAVKMVNNKLLVRQIKEDLKETDGVIYTSDQQHKSFKGEIISVDSSSTFKNGDMVYFSEFAGEKVSFEAEDYLIIDAENVFAVEEDDCTCGESQSCYCMEEEL